MAAIVSEKTVDPTAPISQSMDSPNSPRRSPADSPPVSPTHSTPDLSTASTPSPSRQVDPQLSRVEEYRQLFRLPSEEKIIQFHEITAVRRAKAVAVFPTAIEIIAAGKKYFFTSFLFRDEAFKLINEGWLQHTDGSHEVTDQQEPKSDISNQENDSSMVEESGSSRHLVDTPDIIESEENGPILEEPIHVGGDESTIVTTSTVIEVREEVNPEATPACSSSPWKPEDTDAPGVLEGFTKVAESKFPLRVEEFFNLFFSDDGINFHESFHTKCGDKDFKCTSWQPHAEVGYTRDVSFQHPIKLYFGARFGSCQEVQKYRVYRNCRLIIDTSQEISDVPYADYFKVEGRWDVEEDGNELRPGCILRVYTNVAFSKKTMWKGKIVQSTVEECREAYESWIDLAHQVLKRKNLEKEEGASASKLITNGQPQSKKVEIIQQQQVEHVTSDVRISEPITAADVNNLNLVSNNLNPTQGNAGGTSVLRDAIAKACTSLKYQNTSSLLLLISVVVILLLMQISIIVLLSRPQRIHVVSQGCGQRMGESSGEAMASLNKQIRYLKDEMHFVETMMEKMRSEHSQLNAKLKDLELFGNRN